MPASGKTTVAIKVAELHGIKYLCGGDILKNLAISKGYQYSGNDWWDTANGMKFLEERKKSYQFDHEVDNQLIKSIKEGDVAVTSYTAPWLSKTGVKIWLKASPSNRAKRLASRDKISYKEALNVIQKRDTENINIYKNIYNYVLNKDLSVFHFVLDTDLLSKDDVIGIVCNASKYFI
ncbi:cytidylate kinase family protein [Thermoproteota archaeon]